MQNLIHPKTYSQLQAIGEENAMLWLGPSGSWHQHIHSWWAKRTGRLPIWLTNAKDANRPPGIEDVRQLISLLVSKQQPLLVAIPHVDEMSNEAANSILKIVEEQPQSVQFVLLGTKSQRILPTLHSRTSEIKFYPLPQRQYIKAVQELNRELDDAAAASQYMLTRGLIFLELNKKENIENAKTIVSGDISARLGLIDSLSKDKQRLNDVLKIATNIIRIQLRNSTSTKRFTPMGNEILRAQDLLKKQVNTKLILLNLMLKL